jgi:integrase
MTPKQIKLTKTIIAAAEPRKKEYSLWDTEVRKFGVRIATSGRKMFVYQYRFNRRPGRLTLGPVDVLSVTVARDLAREAAVKISRGIDPGAERDAKRNAITVAELAERFDAAHVTFHVKDSTAREYRFAVKKYILPELGTKKVAEVTRAHVAALHHKMRDKPTQANRTIEVVSKMFNLAEEWGYRQPNTNPRKGLKKYPETKRERFFSEAELQRLGEVLEEMETERIEMPSAIAAVRLLMFTGCRLGEIMTLQWRFVDLKAGVLRLPDSKTGKKLVQLGAPAVAVLHGLEKVEDNHWVLPGRVQYGRLTDLQPFWQRLRARAGLKDARIHDLRHTFASYAAASGMSLHMIGKLLGHTSTQTTKRYAHLAEGTVKVAANDVSNAIAGHMPVASAGLRKV